MSFRIRRGPGSFSIGPRGPRANDRLACLLPAVLLVAACGATAGLASPTVGAQAPSAVAVTPGLTTSPTTVPTEVPADTPDPTIEEPSTTVYRAGDVINVTINGDPWADITVSKVKVVRKYDGPYNLDDIPAKGSVYIQAFVTYVAKTDGVDYNPYDWQVFAAGEAVDNSTYVSNGPTPELSSGTLPSGRKASGWVVYEVPAKGEVRISYGGVFSNDAPVFEVIIRNS